MYTKDDLKHDLQTYRMAMNQHNFKLAKLHEDRILQAFDERQADLLVKQLLALVNFLIGYHNEASEARYKIGLETDLERAKHIAIFEYPVIQGLMFNLTLKQMDKWGLPSDNDLIDGAMEYIEKNYKPSKQSA